MAAHFTIFNRAQAALLLLAMLFLINGCTVGPDYIKPSVTEPKAWVEKDNNLLKTDTIDLVKWWSIFEDPVLDALVEKAYLNNPGVHIAGLRILEARAQLGILVGNRYPQLQQLRGEMGAVGISENSANTTPGTDFRYGEIGIGFDAGWEMDFWGKFNRAINSGVNTLDSSIADYDNTLVTLTAEVAKTYMLLQTYQRQLNIANDNVRIQRRSLQIANVLFKGGDVTELDVAQARTLLASTQASVPRFESQIRQTKNTLALLLGILPTEIDPMLGKPGIVPNVPTEIAIGIPAEMLRRRPDIRRVEHQMLAQSELIGVTEADLYPHFSLVGSIGLSSSDSGVTSDGYPGSSSFGDLFNSSSIDYFIGPTFSWDFLNYGRIKNKVRIEDARFQQVAESYKNTVLQAAQEVENGIVSFLRSQEEQIYLRESANAAARSVDLSMLQYKEGLDDFQRVLESQRSLVLQQDLLAANQGNVAVNLIFLYKALGGGWESRLGDPFIPDSIRDQMQERTDWGEMLDTDAISESTDNSASYDTVQPAW